MKTSITTTAGIGKRLNYGLYLMLLFFVTITGFAQMPIFKRYYIADIPGLGWLAQFYVTHFLLKRRTKNGLSRLLGLG